MQELLNLSKHLMKLRVFKSTLTLESSMLSYYKHEVEEYIRGDVQGIVEVLLDTDNAFALRVYNVELTLKIN